MGFAYNTYTKQTTLMICQMTELKRKIRQGKLELQLSWTGMLLIRE